MSRCINRVTLLGNVGQDPEVRTTQSGNRVATFTMATSRQWTDGQGAKQEATAWHRCVAWDQGKYKLASIVEDYVRKGTKVHVDGEIEYRQWQDKDGQTRYTTEIKVRELILLGSKSDGDAGAKPASKSAPARAAKPAPVDDDFSDFPAALEDEDDGLPF